MNALAPVCLGCGKRPSALAEYRERVAEEPWWSDEDDLVRSDEGTYNRENGHFWCTACYIAAGMPKGVAP